jgi:hypothetical protein
LRETAVYRRDIDTVPVPETLSVISVQRSLDSVPTSSRGAEVPVNVLADEYWDLYAVLLS